MVMLSERQRKFRPRASAAEVETVALAMVSKFFLMASKISTDSPRASGRMLEPASMERRTNSLQPPPPGMRPTPASTRPM